MSGLYKHQLNLVPPPDYLIDVPEDFRDTFRAQGVPLDAPYPNPKQHAIVSIQLNRPYSRMSYVGYPEKSIRYYIVAPFLELSVVNATLPFSHHHTIHLRWHFGASVRPATVLQHFCNIPRVSCLLAPTRAVAYGLQSA